MKQYLLALFLVGCSAEAANKSPDAGSPSTKSSVYVENRFKWVYVKYYPVCVQQCFKDTYSDECPQKCRKDFAEIKKVLTRAVRDNTEDDFDAVMESWYGR
jgi:hypothetical protein